MRTRLDDACGHSWDRHVLLLHHTEQQRRAGLAAWVRRGLDRREKIIYAERVTEPRSRRLVTVLADAGVDVAGATASGQIQVMDASEFYRPGVLSSLVEQALSQAYPGVRVSAERDTALSVLGERVHDQFERDSEDLCHRQPISVMCQYHASQATGDRLATVAAAHPAGIHEALISTSGRHDTLTFAGEIDITNAALVGAAVSTALGRTTGVFRLDLSEVRFLDVCGARSLLRASEPYRAAGGRLWMTAVGGPHLLLDTLGLTRVSNLVLTGSNR